MSRFDYLFQNAPEQQAPESDTGFFSNWGNLFASGFAGGIESDLETVEQLGGGTETLAGYKKAFGDVSKAAIDNVSPELVEAMNQKASEGFDDVDWWLGNLGQLTGTIGAFMATGFGIGTGVKLGAKGVAKVIGSEMAEAAVKKGLNKQAASAVGTISAGLMMGGGDRAKQARQEFEGLTDAELDQTDSFVEEYWRLNEEGFSQDIDTLRNKAKENLGEQAASKAFANKKAVAADLLASGLAGYMGGFGSPLSKISKPPTTIKGKVGSGVAKESLTEAGQEGAAQLASNEALQELGVNRNLDYNVGEAALAGGLLGVPSGAIGGLMNRPQELGTLDKPKNKIMPETPKTGIDSIDQQMNSTRDLINDSQEPVTSNTVEPGNNPSGVQPIPSSLPPLETVNAQIHYEQQKRELGEPSMTDEAFNALLKQQEEIIFQNGTVDQSTGEVAEQAPSIIDYDVPPSERNQVPEPQQPLMPRGDTSLPTVARNAGATNTLEVNQFAKEKFGEGKAEKLNQQTQFLLDKARQTDPVLSDQMMQDYEDGVITDEYLPTVLGAIGEGKENYQKIKKAIAQEREQEDLETSNKLINQAAEKQKAQRDQTKQKALMSRDQLAAEDMRQREAELEQEQAQIAEQQKADQASRDERFDYIDKYSQDKDQAYDAALSQVEQENQTAETQQATRKENSQKAIALAERLKAKVGMSFKARGKQLTKEIKQKGASVKLQYKINKAMKDKQDQELGMVNIDDYVPNSAFADAFEKAKAEDKPVIAAIDKAVTPELDKITDADKREQQQAVVADALNNWTASNVTSPSITNVDSEFNQFDLPQRESEVDEQAPVTQEQSPNNETPLPELTKTDDKGREWTYFETTKEKNGIKTTSYSFNRNDKSAEQRNNTGVTPDVLTQKGYEIDPDDIPENTQVSKVFKMSEGQDKSSATVQFIPNGGKFSDSFESEVKLIKKDPNKPQATQEQSTENVDKSAVKERDNNKSKLKEFFTNDTDFFNNPNNPDSELSYQEFLETSVWIARDTSLDPNEQTDNMFSPVTPEELDLAKEAYNEYVKDGGKRFKESAKEAELDEANREASGRSNDSDIEKVKAIMKQTALEQKGKLKGVRIKLAKEKLNANKIAKEAGYENLDQLESEIRAAYKKGDLTADSKVEQEVDDIAIEDIESFDQVVGGDIESGKSNTDSDTQGVIGAIDFSNKATDNDIKDIKQAELNNAQSNGNDETSANGDPQVSSNDQRGDTGNSASTNGTSGSGNENFDKAELTASNGTKRSDQKRTTEPFNLDTVDDIASATSSVRVAENLAAIRLLKKLQAEKRPATNQEKSILARYVGWGGIKAIADPNTKVKFIQEARAELQTLLTKTELNHLQGTITTAFYTSKDIVKAMWEGVRAFGLGADKMNVLEPSVGSGNFIGWQPTDMRKNSSWSATELDSVTGGIAAAIYDDSNIKVSGFEKANFKEGVFSLAMGNPPFGSMTLNDSRFKDISGMSLHNFMIAKTSKLLHENGLSMMVITHNFLDNKNANHKDLSKTMDLVGAVRLPKTAFKANAGTEVTTDIVVFRKLKKGETAKNTSWHDVNGSVNGITINKYFEENPQNILGELSMAGTQYAKDGELTVLPTDAHADLSASITNALTNMAKGVDVSVDTEITERIAGEVMLSESDLSVGGMMINAQGNVLMREENTGSGANVVEVTADTSWGANGAIFKDLKAIGKDKDLLKGYIQSNMLSDKGTVLASYKGSGANKVFNTLHDYIDDKASLSAYNLELTKAINRDKLGDKSLQKLKDILIIRNTALELLKAERLDRPNIELLRARLNKQYDTFATTHKVKSKLATIDKSISLLKGDIDLESGLDSVSESGEIKKHDMFTQRMLEPYIKPERAKNVDDAVNFSMQEHGKVNIAYIADMLNVSVTEATQQLTTGDSPYLLQDPESDSYVFIDDYLSGNVKHKHKIAKENGLVKNITLLEKVLPKDKPASKVQPTIRATWMDQTIFEKFLEALGNKGTVSISRSIGQIKAESNTVEQTELGALFKSDDASINKIFEHAASGKALVIYNTVNENRVKNVEATKRVAVLVNKMADTFKTWANSDPDIKTQITKNFNDNLNTHIERSYNGRLYLQTVGQNPKVALRKTQLDGALRMIQSKNVLLDHTVGAGKTYTAITGIMQRRRLGLSKKPLVVMPNHIIGSFAADFYKLYPNAKILVADKDGMSAKNRKRFFARIATGNYDAILIGHSHLKTLPDDPSSFEATLNEKIDELREALNKAKEEAKADGSRGASTGQIENSITNLTNKIAERKTKLAEAKDSIGFTFKDLGIDYMVVDEAHEFKNLMYSTRSDRVVGMNDPKGSDKAMDLLVKVRTIQNEVENGGITFMTGTPISNSLVELYTVMYYLGHKDLKASQMSHYDAFAGSFINTETALEYTATGTVKERRVLKGLNSVKELSTLYRQFADVIAQHDMVNIFAEDTERSNKEKGENESTRFPIPNIVGGARQLNTGKASDRQLQYTDYLIARMEAIEAITGKQERLEYASIDNPLWVLSDAKKASLDIRLVDPKAPADENSKVNRSATEIKKLYDTWHKDKGTQLVFSDMGVPVKSAIKNTKGDLVKIAKGLMSEVKAKKWVNDTLAFHGDTQAYERTLQELEAKVELAVSKEEIDADKEEVLTQAIHDTKGAAITADTGFSVYDDLRKQLIAKGIPENEIAFIHDYNGEKAKKKLFDKVNEGSIRVLIGSSAKMGAGTNVQKRLVGLHHLDAPWRPSDMEQREGRIIRQGNLFYERAAAKGDPESFEVTINAYATEGSSDPVMWQILERKAESIEQFRRGQLEEFATDTNSDANSYADFKAQSTGNPIYKQKLESDLKVTEVEADYTAAAMSYGAAKRTVKDYDSNKVIINRLADRLDSVVIDDLKVFEEEHHLENQRFLVAQEAFEISKAEYLALSKKEIKERKIKKPKAPTRKPLYEYSNKISKAINSQIIEPLSQGMADKIKQQRVSVDLGNNIKLMADIDRVDRDDNSIDYNIESYLNIDEQYIDLFKTWNVKTLTNSTRFVNSLSPINISTEVATYQRNNQVKLASLEKQYKQAKPLLDKKPDQSKLMKAELKNTWLEIETNIADLNEEVRRSKQPNSFIDNDQTRNVSRSAFDPKNIKPETITIDGETYKTLGVKFKASKASFEIRFNPAYDSKGNYVHVLTVDTELAKHDSNEAFFDAMPDDYPFKSRVIQKPDDVVEQNIDFTTNEVVIKGGQRFNGLKDERQSPLFFNRKNSDKVESVSSPVTVKDAQVEAEKFLENFPGLKGTKVFIGKTNTDMYGSEQGISGAYDPNQDAMHLTAAKHSSIRELRATIHEELLVHKGLGLYTEQERLGIYRAVVSAAKSDPQVNKIYQQVKIDYKGSPDWLIAEETLGKIAHSTDLNMNWSSQAMARLRAFFRKILKALKIGSTNPTQKDLAFEVQKIAYALRKGKTPAPRNDSGDGNKFLRKGDKIETLRKDQLNDGNTMLDQALGDDVNKSRRGFLKQLAGASVLTGAGITGLYSVEQTWKSTKDIAFGQSKSITEKETRARLPQRAIALAKNGGSAKDVLRAAMGEASPDMKKLIRKLIVLIPKNITVKVDTTSKVNAHGSASMKGDGVELTLYDTDLKQAGLSDIAGVDRLQGLTYGTFIHEALHGVVMARYRGLSSGAIAKNYKLVNMGSPKAMPELKQFIDVWQEFKSDLRKTHSNAEREALMDNVWLSTAYNDPDEFFVRALTDANLQNYLSQREYKGRTLMERFKDWVSRVLFKKTGTIPSWLDAALLTSNDLLVAMGKDAPDYRFVNAVKGFRSSNSHKSDNKDEVFYDQAMLRNSETPAPRTDAGNGGKFFRKDSSPAASFEDVISRNNTSVWDKVKQVLFENKFSEAVKRQALGTVTLRQIGDLASKVLPQINSYVDVVHKMLTSRNVMAEKAATIVEKWQAWAAKNKPMADQLSEIMHNSTQWGADPSEAFKDATPILKHREKVITELLKDRAGDKNTGKKAELNAELKALHKDLKDEPRRKEAHQRLKPEWDRLSPEAQAFYKQIRDEYSERNQHFQNIMLQRIEKAELEERTRKEMLERLRFEFEKSDAYAPYFPLSRHGSYWLETTDQNGERVYMMFETEGEQKRTIKNLKEEYGENYPMSFGHVLDKDMESDGASITFVKSLVDTVEGSDLGMDKSKELRDSVYQLYLENLPSRSIRKNFIHRKGVKGYSQDAIRGFASNMMRGAYQLSRLEYSDELNDHMESMKDASVTGNDKARYYNEMKKRHEWVMNPTNSAITSQITGLGFIYMLGISPAAALVNTTQNFIVAMPVLNAHFKGNAASELLKASQEFVGGKGTIESKLKGDELRAYKAWHDLGLIESTRAHDLAGIAETDAYNYSSTQHKWMNGISKLFHKAEVYNRETTAIAAYRLARKDGIPHSEAVKKASDLTWDAHFDYTNVNRARFMQNDFMKVMTQFKQYSQNMSYYLWRNLHQMIKGATPEEKAIAKKQLLGTLGMTSVVGGTAALPLWLVFGIANLLNADDDEPFDAEAEFTQYLIDLTGSKDTADLIIHGAGGAGISPRISLDSLWIRDPNRDLEGRDLWAHYAQQVAGATFGGIVPSTLEGFRKISEGKIVRGIENIVPKAFRDVIKMLRYNDEGAQTMRGIDIKSAKDFTPTQLFMQSIGFSDAETNKQYMRNNAIKGYEQHIKDRRSELMSRFYIANKHGDQSERAKILKSIARFNSINPGVSISSTTLKMSMKSKQRTERRSSGGVYIDKKLDYLREDFN